VDESDGRQVRVEGAGQGCGEIGRDVAFGVHRQVDEDVLDHDASRVIARGDRGQMMN